MKEFVAVNYPLLATDIQILKREALMFNRIAIPNLNEAFLSKKKELDDMQDAIRDLEWLLDAGIVFEPTLAPDAKIPVDEYETNLDSAIRHAKEIVGLILGFSLDELVKARENDEKKSAIKEKVDELPKRTHKEMKEIVESEDFMKNVMMMTGYFTRVYSIQLRELSNLDAYPILPTDINLLKEQQGGKGEVVEIVFNSLPVPDVETSWEQIIEYRSDPDSQNKFLDLRHWISEVARGELRPTEVEEKLEYLLSQYRRHMEIHRMKANVGTLESFVITSAEMLGDLLSFKWGKIANALFSIKHRKIALIEGELTAPGNEVAYIVKTRDVFS